MKLDRHRLQRAREMLGYGIEKTAQEAGVSKNSVLRAEHEQDIRPVTARKIAQALHVPVADLLPKAQSPLPLDFEERARAHVEQLSDIVDESRVTLERRLEELEERHEAAYDVALNAARRQDRQDLQAAVRAIESGRAQTYFMRHDNEALQRLLGYPADELASAVLEMAHRVVELEAQLQAASVMNSEQTRTRST